MFNCYFLGDRVLPCVVPLFFFFCSRPLHLLWTAIYKASWWWMVLCIYCKYFIEP